LKPESVKVVPQPRLFLNKFGLDKQWAAVDKTLAEGTPVIIKGLDTFIGGEKSKYRSGTSHHVVLFLAKGMEEDFYVGYDPDVSATAATLAAWKLAADYSGGDTNRVICNMVLGTGEKVLGPLCRKYYVDKKLAFPQIDRFASQ